MKMTWLNGVKGFEHKNECSMMTEEQLKATIREKKEEIQGIEASMKGREDSLRWDWLYDAKKIAEAKLEAFELVLNHE